MSNPTKKPRLPALPRKPNRTCQVAVRLTRDERGELDRRLPQERPAVERLRPRPPLGKGWCAISKAAKWSVEMIQATGLKVRNYLSGSETRHDIIGRDGKAVQMGVNESSLYVAARVVEVRLGSREGTALASSPHVRNRPARLCRNARERRSRQLPAAKTEPRAESEAKTRSRVRARVKTQANRRSGRSQNRNHTAALNARQLAGQLASGWVCFYPFPMFRSLSAAADWFSGFMLTAAEALPGRKFAVFDELQLYGDGSRPPEKLVDVFNTGRNFGIDSAYVTQSFGEVSRELVKQTSEAVAFHTTDSSNGWWLRKWGFDVAAVERLAPGSYHARDLMRSRGAVGRVF